MTYITHRRYRRKAMCGKELNLRYGTELECKGNILYTPQGEAVCFDTSENAHMYFSRNNDGRGLERGALTHAIAYAKRGKGFRFNEEEREMLCRDYVHWLNTDVDFILFNHDFFNADVDELRALADRLKIKV